MIKAIQKKFVPKNVKFVHVTKIVKIRKFFA